MSSYYMHPLSISSRSIPNWKCSSESNCETELNYDHVYSRTPLLISSWTVRSSISRKNQTPKPRFVF